MSVFQEFFARLTKFSFSQEDWALGYHSTKFRDFPNISQGPKSEDVPQPVTKLVYIMFTSNTCASFHLRWKENLVKHQRVWKYYENDCLQNFLLLFISLLTAPIVKKKSYLGYNLLYLSKIRPNINRKVF